MAENFSDHLRTRIWGLILQLSTAVEFSRITLLPKEAEVGIICNNWILKKTKKIDFTTIKWITYLNWYLKHPTDLKSTCEFISHAELKEN